DLDVVLDQHPSGLRDLEMALGTEEDEAVAVLADCAARVDQYVVADQGALDGRAGADVAVPADLDAGADHRADADHRAAPDLDLGTDDGERIDHHAVLQTRRRIDDRRRRNAVIADRGLRPQRVAVPFPGDPDEGTERLRHAQRGDVCWHLRLEARADETRAG